METLRLLEEQALTTAKKALTAPIGETPLDAIAAANFLLEQLSNPANTKITEDDYILPDGRHIIIT